MVETGLSSGMRWSGISMMISQSSRIIFTVLLARLIGPEYFGIAAQALVYILLVTILLDQGFSTVLIQKPDISPELPGATVSVNIAIGGACSALTVVIAPFWASFMHTPELATMLLVLSPSLLIRSATVTPRAMLMRNMSFRAIGLTDSVAAVTGAVLGLAAALVWANYWAMVVQLVCTDIVTLVIFMLVGAAYRPNLQLRLIREVGSFVWRAFGAMLLINSISVNMANVLIGRFLGAEAVGFYGLANRVFMVPVQLASTSVGTVLFPMFSRLASDASALRSEMARATRALAMLSIPALTLVAVAAPQLVILIFGSEWNPTTRIVQGLAVAGALQVIYKPSTSPLLLATDRARLVLRYAWVTTVAAGIGVVAGLPFGPFGVAVGYSAAAVLLLPVEWLIRRRILGMTIGEQAGSLLPACHVALWMAGAYVAIAAVLPGREFSVLALGVPLALALGVAVLRVIHRSLFSEIVQMVNRLFGGGNRVPAT